MDAPEPAPAQPGLVKRLLPPLIAGLCAAGLSFGVMITIGKDKEPALARAPSVPDATQHAPAKPPAEGSKGGKDQLPPPSPLRDLPAVVTNLASPADVWVRLEVSIVLQQADMKEADVLIARVSQDFTGYLRSVSLPQLEGALGLAHLRADLATRAQGAAPGKIAEVIVRSVVVQ